MRTKKTDAGPLTDPLGSGGGPRASTRLGLGGLLWLLACFAFSLWLAPQAGAPLEPRTAAPDPSRAGQVLHDQGDTAAAQARIRLDAVVAQALPLALPAAQWRLELTDAQAGPAVPKPAGNALPQDPLPRRYLITGPCAPLRLGVALLQRFSAGQAVSWAGTAARNPRPQVLWTEQGALEIRLGGRLSHVFRFPGREAALADLARPLPRPALVLVIDDLGQSLEAAEALAALPFPVTFAIWPRSPAAAQTAALAGQRRLDSLLHLPMEALPRADGFRPRPGPDALRVDMRLPALRAVLEEDLKALPTAVGLNNHMGSRFTGNAAACSRLCSLLPDRGLFVLDSLTQAGSALEREARAAGLISASRALFLDTRRDVAAISAALDAAARTAREKGFAVAVGHPYPETLRALRCWQDTAGVAVVPLRRLIWHLAQQACLSPAGAGSGL
ncbi:divergent polysaccharide deacetylase family protein [Desulfovibrio sp. ZJ369]|uniref:divergent polysaccharide deacetylase family protein n=1 Tax=Desulfovibrio sp. ZJ369 TaxID=2709793 RepID=UPI0013EC0F4F|nr:divergent polysaccharide deacetylase family protein [Desulfovibrio sp. ZJ369]